MVDGPRSHPNRRRRVEVIRASDMPEFFLCVDLDDGALLTVHRHNIDLPPAPVAGSGTKSGTAPETP